MKKLHALGFVILLIAPTSALPLTATGEVELSKDPLFEAAMRYVETRFASKKGTDSEVVRMQDRTAGIIQFRYSDGSFTDDGQIEVIEIDEAHSKLRVSVPSDYGGRAELLLQKIRSEAEEAVKEPGDKGLPFPRKQVYESVLRYVLKTFVTKDQKKENVVSVNSRDIGLVRFVYTSGKFRDPQAEIHVVELGPKLTKLFVRMPADPVLHQRLLEDQVTQAIKDDLDVSRE